MEIGEAIVNSLITYLTSPEAKKLFKTTGEMMNSIKQYNEQHQKIKRIRKNINHDAAQLLASLMMYEIKSKTVSEMSPRELAILMHNVIGFWDSLNTIDPKLDYKIVFELLAKSLPPSID